MLRELLDPKYSMLKYDEETRRLWFNSDSLEAQEEFELVGMLLGIAIYNGWDLETCVCVCWFILAGRAGGLLLFFSCFLTPENEHFSITAANSKNDNFEVFYSIIIGIIHTTINIILMSEVFIRYEVDALLEYTLKNSITCMINGCMLVSPRILSDVLGQKQTTSWSMWTSKYRALCHSPYGTS